MGRTVTPTPEENEVHICLETAVAFAGKAEEQIEAVETLISQGNLPEIDKYKLTGCIVHIRTSISGLNDEAATTYAEFRPRKAA